MKPREIFKRFKTKSGKKIIFHVKELNREMDKVIYLRLSQKKKEEKKHLPTILETFKLNKNKCLILAEEISGYKEEVQIKREAMNTLIDMVENKEVKEIYIYSLERLYRNIYWLLEFYFKCKKNDVEIYSCLQPEINNITGDRPIDIFIQLMSVLTNGFVGMQESFLTSQRTKRAVTNINGVNRSYKGNRWGKKRQSSYINILEYKKNNPKAGYSKIAKALNLKSRGVVKYCLDNYMLINGEVKKKND